MDGSVSLLDLAEPLEHEYYDSRELGREISGALALNVRANGLPYFQGPNNYIADYPYHHVRWYSIYSFIDRLFFDNFNQPELSALYGGGYGTKVLWMVARPRPLLWILTDVPLEQLRDEGSIRNVDPTTLIQVAIQKDGIVILHGPTFNKMNRVSKIALLMHEALVRLVNVSNPDLIKEKGTSPIRNFNRLFIMRKFENKFVPEQVYAEAFDALGIPDLFILDQDAYRKSHSH